MEIKRMLSSDFKIGDVFVDLNDSEYSESTVVRIIKTISQKDWSYEYFNGLSDSYIIESSTDGLSKKDVLLELRNGTMLFLGNFNL